MTVKQLLSLTSLMDQFVCVVIISNLILLLKQSSNPFVNLHYALQSLGSARIFSKLDLALSNTNCPRRRQDKTNELVFFHEIEIKQGGDHSVVAPAQQCKCNLENIFFHYQL